MRYLYNLLFSFWLIFIFFANPNIVFATHQILLNTNQVSTDQDFSITVIGCPLGVTIDFSYIRNSGAFRVSIDKAYVARTGNVIPKLRFLDGGQYFIFANCSNHEVSASLSVTSLKSLTSPPTNLTTSRINDTGVNISWFNLLYTEKYVIFYVEKDQYSSGNYNQVETVNTSTRITPLKPGTEYILWLNGCNSGGCSPPSASISFKTTGTSPAISSPAPPSTPVTSPIVSYSINNQLKSIFNNSLVAGKFSNLGEFVSIILQVMFFIGAFMMFTYMLWGAYQYMIAQGKKEDLAKARQRITWALLGFLFLVMAFFLYGYAKTIFPQVNTFTKVTKLTIPCTSEQEKKCKSGIERCFVDSNNVVDCKPLVPTPTP